MNIPKDTQTDVFSVLAAILHLGNIQFKPNATQKDRCQVADKNG